MPNFRKKPVVIEAIQYDGTENSVVEILQLKETNSSAKSIRVDMVYGLLVMIKDLFAICELQIFNNKKIMFK